MIEDLNKTKWVLILYDMKLTATPNFETLIVYSDVPIQSSKDYYKNQF